MSDELKKFHIRIAHPRGDSPAAEMGRASERAQLERFIDTLVATGYGEQIALLPRQTVSTRQFSLQCTEEVATLLKTAFPKMIVENEILHGISPPKLDFGGEAP